MSDFDKAFAWLMDLEGGWSNDPSDAGGETKYGISQRTYPNLDIANLTLEEARGIYLVDWWKPGGYAAIDDQHIANKTFDAAVNMGALNAHKLLQRACNDCGAIVTVDGHLGPITFGAINSLDPAVLLDAFRLRMKEYYLELIARKPSNAKFRNGWLKRAAL